MEAIAEEVETSMVWPPMQKRWGRRYKNGGRDEGAVKVEETKAKTEVVLHSKRHVIRCCLRKDTVDRSR